MGKYGGTGSQQLSEAARSRMADRQTGDLFPDELKLRTIARAVDAGSGRYEVMKAGVRRRAKTPAHYECEIKSGAKRLGY
jgi:hypothetical protein